MSVKSPQAYVLCIQSEGYSASLERRKIYEVVPDETAEHRGMLRVIDESGEDCLFPAGWFVAIDVPQAARDAFSNVA